MARPQRMVSRQRAEEFLLQGTWGVLSMTEPDGAPYAVPVNYIYDRQDDALYFHCAPLGRKLDALRAQPRVCFTVVAGQRIIPEKLTTRYRSALAFGTACVVEDAARKADILTRLCAALAPGESSAAETIRAITHRTGVVRIQIEELTGKENLGD